MSKLSYLTPAQRILVRAVLGLRLSETQEWLKMHIIEPSELDRRIMQATKLLSETEQTIVGLCYGEGLTLQEATRVCAVSQYFVATMLQRARVTIRRPDVQDYILGKYPNPPQGRWTPENCREVSFLELNLTPRIYFSILNALGNVKMGVILDHASNLTELPGIGDKAAPRIWSELYRLNLVDEATWQRPVRVVPVLSYEARLMAALLELNTKEEEVIRAAVDDDWDDTLCRIKTAVRNMRPKEQTIVRLFFEEGLNSQGVAERLGTSRQSVWQRKKRLERKLRRVLDIEGPQKAPL